MTTSDDLVVGSGGGVGTRTWRDQVSGQPHSAPEVAKAGRDTDNTGFGGCPRRYHPPPALGPRSTDRTVLWLSPPGLHPTVTGSLSTPSVLPLILQGHPRPRCPAELAALRPLGIDRPAGDARPRLRSHRPLPRPGYAGRGLGAASSRLRAAAGPGSRPAAKAETDWLLPIAPASPLQG